MLNSWWKENYNIKTNGIWLAERVWNPDLPPVLHDLNGEFVFLDENIFKKVGLSETETFGVYVTEDQGKKIVIIPINERIRYLVPWNPPDMTLKYLAKACDPNHKKIIIMMSDAEKMGAWQAGDRTTYDICYISGHDGKPWLKNFFEQIRKNKWIKPILISNYLKKHNPIGLIYLPTGSYDKMSEWALPSDLRKKYAELKEKSLTKEFLSIEGVADLLMGSIWQNFIVKNSQANIMHKRMLFTRNKLEIAESELLGRFPDEIQEIWENILASQANDAYWHGIFGGIYYVFLRHSIHKHIINADYLLDQLYIKVGYDIPGIQTVDILFDGSFDGVLENKYVSCFISSLYGGSVFSLNLKGKNYNFLNTLTRQIESYHDDTFPVIQDRFEKWMCQDHFVLEGTLSEDYLNDSYQELGDFANQQYVIKRTSACSLTCSRHGKIKYGNLSIKAFLEKKFTLQKNKLTIMYNIYFDEEVLIENLMFSPEINIIAVSHPYKSFGTYDNNFFDLNHHTPISECQKIGLFDLNPHEKVGIQIKFSESISCEIFPLYSYPKSGVGYEKLYQGTSIYPKIKISGKKTNLKITVRLDEILDDYDNTIRKKIIPRSKIIPDP